MRFFIILSLLLTTFNLSVNAVTCDKVKFYQGDKIKAEFKIHISDTPETRRKGLMFVKELPQDQGELFVWNDLKQRFMWMRNTYISLDMIFIKRNKVVGIIKHTTPESLKTLTVPEKVDKVLEINAGLADKFKIEKGDYFSCVVDDK